MSGNPAIREAFAQASARHRADQLEQELDRLRPIAAAAMVLMGSEIEIDDGETIYRTAVAHLEAKKALRLAIEAYHAAARS